MIHTNIKIIQNNKSSEVHTFFRKTIQTDFTKNHLRRVKILAKAEVKLIQSKAPLNKSI